jgi:NTE family protein
MDKKVTLVLGGGGARGFAHIGLLKALEENQIRIHQIIGVSIGAIVGGLYAFYADAAIVEQRMREFLFSEEFKKKHYYDLRDDLDKISDSFWDQVVKVVKERIVINLAASKIALTDGEDLAEGIHRLYKEIHSFGDVKIPFKCLATDLISGEPVIFDKGDIKFAVRASASIPGYFPPLEYGSMLLVDGAVANNIPANIAREVCPNHLIIVSDVSETIDKKVELDSVYDVIIRSANITQYQYRKHLIKLGDVVIEHPVGKYVWYDFEKFDQLIELGQKATREKIDEIRKKLRKRLFSFDSIMKWFGKTV